VSFQVDVADATDDPSSRDRASIPIARSTTATLNPAPPHIASAQVRSAPSDAPLTWADPSGEYPTSRRQPTPEPRLRQLMGVCGWAAVLGGISLIVTLRGLFGVIAGSPPAWYEPSAVAVGLTGIALTVAAFVTVHRQRVPWFLLGGATIFLLAAMIVTAIAF
jgi:hypothetical protein